MQEKSSQFLSSEQPCDPKSLEVFFFFKPPHIFYCHTYKLLTIHKHTLITILKTSNYTTYNTAFTNTSLQYMSNAYLNIIKKKKKKKKNTLQPNTYSSKNIE